MAFIDARTLPNDSTIEADLIVIGGGMAGIAIAREWAGLDKQVVILESGDRDSDEATQDLSRGAAVMSAPGNSDRDMGDYLHASRFRALGGAGNIWGAKCVPLDPSDFERRDWLPMSGWPMTRNELQPYYDRACQLLEVPLFDRDWNALQEADRPPLVIDGGRDFFSAPRFFSPLSGQANPQRFDAYRTEFAAADNIRVYLNANVLRLDRENGEQRLRGLDVGCLNGTRFKARAQAYVLATGGIENARLLLSSDIEHPLLGRCFMGHVTFAAFDPTKPVSVITISDANQSTALYADVTRERGHCVIAATLAGQQRFGIGNFTATMNNLPPGIQAPNDTSAVIELSAGLDAGADSEARVQPTYFMSEHLPNPESRITLDASQVDALGMPRVKLSWVYSRQDLDNLEAGVAALASTLGAERIGRLCWPVARSDLVDVLEMSRHHVGTTRMSTDPDNGVVDSQCRMHEIDNLYIAGSSVFPTSGIANPTLTIIALAQRLSDTLKQQLGVRP